MQTKVVERYFFFGFLLIIFIFTFFIFRPFWIVLVLGASLSVMLYPIYKWFKKMKLPDWLASTLTLLFFIIVLCIPFLSIGSLVFNQSQDIYHSVVNNGNTGTFINSLGNEINNILPSGIVFNINEQISSLISLFVNNITNIFSATISAFFSFILVLLSTFYFLKDGEKWKKELLKLSPLSDVDDQKIVTKLSKTINGVMNGTLLIALIQGLLIGIGFTIFGVPNGALFGVVAAIASLIPSIGTALVSVPAIIFLFAIGHTVPAIGLLIWSIFIVGTIDNFLAPYVIGNKINIPPFLILFSVLGGISLLGPVGVLIGPLTVSLLYTLISIYRNEFQKNEIL